MENDYKSNFDRKINIVKQLIKYVKAVEKMCQNAKVDDEYFVTCDYDKLIGKLEYVIEKYERVKNEYEDYNEQYKKYIEEKYEQLLRINQGNISQMDKYFLDNCKRNFEAINNYVNINLDELFDKFKYGNKNYVIFGKNGAGKSSLAFKISNDILSGNTFVMPAYKNIRIDYGYGISNYELNENSINSVFVSNSAIILLIMKLLNKVQFETIENRKKGDLFAQTSFDKLKSIFESLNLDRDINIIENQTGRLFLNNEEKNIENYDLSEASDGERDVVFFILAVLLLPKNAFLFIDEPENHLNGQLMIKLFDELEKIRTDIKFVYLTHNIHFIESRSNVELIYLEKTDRKETWNYREMDDFKEISTDILLSIEGSDKDVIFCEGNDNTSFDYKILREVYEDFLIYPLSSCEEVVDNVKVCNKNASKLRRKSYGIIDRDSRTTQEINKLQENNIFVYDFSEIENLLLNEEIVKYLFSKLESGEEKYKKAVDNICETITNKLSDILSEYITKVYYRIVKSSKLKYDDLENDIDKINNSNKIEIIKLVESLKNDIQKNLDTKNYSELVKIVPGKMIIKDVANAGGFCDKFAYFDWFIQELKNNIEFKEKVRKLLPKI